jgi:hypothetical protein
MTLAVLERSRPEQSAGDRPVGEAPQSDQVFVTLTVADQLCGVPVLGVRDVLGPQTITRIPLAPPEIAGCVAASGCRRRRRALRACRWWRSRAASSTRFWSTR